MTWLYVLYAVLGVAILAVVGVLLRCPRWLDDRPHPATLAEQSAEHGSIDTERTTP
jgi:hypothetical protein